MPSSVNAKRTSQRECPSQLAVANRYEGQIDDGQQHGKRHWCDLGEQHRHAGYTAVDEIAGHQETLEPHSSERLSYRLRAY